MHCLAPRRLLLCLPLLLFVVSWQTASAHTQAPPATADLRGASGESIGSVSFTTAPQEVLISIAFRNRTALVGTHAVHVHSVGQCDPPSFVTVGPVLSALPDLVIGPAGVGVYNLSAPGAALDSGPNSLLGRSLVIFDQPGGIAGTPIACAVIGGSATQAADKPDPQTSLAIALMGGLLIASGIVLRRRT